MLKVANPYLLKELKLNTKQHLHYGANAIQRVLHTLKFKRASFGCCP